MPPERRARLSEGGLPSHCYFDYPYAAIKSELAQP